MNKVPYEAMQAWQRELTSIPMSEHSLENYTKAFADAYVRNNMKYINATIDALLEYTIASLAQILRYTAEPSHRGAFNAMWKKYELSYPRLRANLERTKKG